MKCFFEVVVEERKVVVRNADSDAKGYEGCSNNPPSVEAVRCTGATSVARRHRIVYTTGTDAPMFRLQVLGASGIKFTVTSWVRGRLIAKNTEKYHCVIRWKENPTGALRGSQV